MGTTFWIKRFFVVLAAAFVIISVVQAFKGHELAYSVTHGAIWGVLSTTVFTVARFFQARRGQHCALCKDTPEMRQASERDA